MHLKIYSAIWRPFCSGPNKSNNVTVRFFLLAICLQWGVVNTLRPRQNSRHLPNDIFKCIFMNEKFCISINFSLKFVPKGPIQWSGNLCVESYVWIENTEHAVVSIFLYQCITSQFPLNQDNCRDTRCFSGRLFTYILSWFAPEWKEM